MEIRLNQVSKYYDKKVIDDIDLHVEGYNTVAIIGKSGCGKSTLLRLLTGIEKVDEGEVLINDAPLNRDYQDTIGMVFQQHNLFPHLSLMENITLILKKIKGIDKLEAEEIALRLLEKMQLDDEKHKLPKHVSGGQAQRASIARALATKPEIVFMDEPTAALDPILTKEVLDAVLGIKETGTQFIFVTHELDFVRKFAEYVIFMDQGKIVEHGEVSILSKPKTLGLKIFLNKGEVA